MAHQIIIRSADEIASRCAYLTAQWTEFWDWSQPMSVEWKVHRESRSLSQNSLYWKWMSELAIYFSSKSNQPYTRDHMHDLMRHKFLGYVDNTIGNTVIKQQLRSTTGLDKPDFHHYLEQIDAWAADHGALLTHPEDSEYRSWKEAQVS